MLVSEIAHIHLVLSSTLLPSMKSNRYKGKGKGEGESKGQILVTIGSQMKSTSDYISPLRSN